MGAVASKTVQPLGGLSSTSRVGKYQRAGSPLGSAEQNCEFGLIGAYLQGDLEP